MLIDAQRLSLAAPRYGVGLNELLGGTCEILNAECNKRQVLNPGISMYLPHRTA